MSYIWTRFVNQILSKTHWSLSGPMQTGELASSGGENKLPGSKQKLKKRALTWKRCHEIPWRWQILKIRSRNAKWIARQIVSLWSPLGFLQQILNVAQGSSISVFSNQWEHALRPNQVSWEFAASSFHFDGVCFQFTRPQKGAGWCQLQGRMGKGSGIRFPAARRSRC